MGLARQQWPLAPGAVGRFLVPEPLPEHRLDACHRTDIRQTSRHLVVRDGDRVVAGPRRPLARYESVFAPRWYVPRDDVDLTALTAVDRISGLISFEPDKIKVHLDGTRLRLEPGQSVIPHGPDRDLTTDELAPGRQP